MVNEGCRTRPAVGTCRRLGHQRVPYDPEDYWSQVHPEPTDGQKWVPVNTGSTRPAATVRTAITGYRCSTATIGWDNVDEMPTVYKQGGDSRSRHTAGHLVRPGRDDPRQRPVRTRRCSRCAATAAGAYTASVPLQNRKETSSFQVSPGDLDEAITALLVFRGDGDVERQGAGFERIRHSATV